MNNILKQIFNFLGFSGIGWILDFSVYTILSIFCANLFFNNICGGIVGVTFVFIFSTRFIFKTNSNIPLVVKYFIYIAYQAILMYYISKLLVIINTSLITFINFSIIHTFSAIISKILVTPITMILNFLVLKGIIEKI